MAKPTQENTVTDVESGAPVQPTPVRERKKRTPVAGARDVLTVLGKDENYQYRWVKDSPGRVLRFKDGGWDVVTDSLEVGQRTVDRESKIGSVITKASGDGGTLVLMRIPKEWFNEDQLAKWAQIDALESSMKQEAKEGRYGVLEVTRK